MNESLENVILMLFFPLIIIKSRARREPSADDNDDDFNGREKSAICMKKLSFLIIINREREGEKVFFISFYNLRYSLLFLLYS